MITCYDVAGTMAQQAFGANKNETGISYFPNYPETNAGAPFWINSGVVLNKAKNPQGFTDFCCWWFGPDNDATGKQITEVAAKPCYTFTYEKFVTGVRSMLGNRRPLTCAPSRCPSRTTPPRHPETARRCLGSPRSMI